MNGVQLEKIYHQTSITQVDIATPYQQTGQEAPYCAMPILIFGKYTSIQVDSAFFHLLFCSTTPFILQTGAEK